MSNGRSRSPQIKKKKTFEIKSANVSNVNFELSQKMRARMPRIESRRFFFSFGHRRMSFRTRAKPKRNDKQKERKWIHLNSPLLRRLANLDAHFRVPENRRNSFDIIPVRADWLIDVDRFVAGDCFFFCSVFIWHTSAPTLHTPVDRLFGLLRRWINAWAAWLPRVSVSFSFSANQPKVIRFF